MFFSETNKWVIIEMDCKVIRRKFFASSPKTESVLGCLRVGKKTNEPIVQIELSLSTSPRNAMSSDVCQLSTFLTT